METVEKLIKYALHQKVLFDADGKITSYDQFDLKDVEDKKEKINFVINSDEKKSMYAVDFSNDNHGKNNFIKALRKALPMAEVIDLIQLAVKSKVDSEGETTLVLDITEDDAFLFYENDYIKLTSHEGFFKFKFYDDNEIYNITFNDNSNDITNNIDLASRTAPFVDILIKKIMSSYNVLVVTKASYEPGKKTSPRVASAFLIGKAIYDDIEGETSKLQSRMRVLIRYRDIVNNQTFSETIVDDLDVTFDDGDPIPKFDFFDIVPSKSEAIYGVHKNVSPEEINNIVRVKQYMDDKNGKHRVFEVLRERDGSNLNKLISSRIPTYEKSKFVPRIEFTLTPLTIFSNRIAVKNVKYPITGTIAGCVKSSDYTFNFDPTEGGEIKYEVKDAKGNPHVIDKDNPLVLAVKNNFVFEKSRPENRDKPISDCIKVCVGCKKTTVNLYEENPEYYGTEIYKNVYFDESIIIRYSDPNSNIAEYYKNKTHNGKPLAFLNSDMQVCKVSGKRYFFNHGKARRNDMKGVPANKVILKDDGLNGYTISSEANRKFYVADIPGTNINFTRTCAYCKEEYSAAKSVWDKYVDIHKIVNVDNHHCCEKCANTEGEDGEKFILYDPRGFYFESGKQAENLAYCPVCQANGTDEFLYTGKAGQSQPLVKCSVCNQYCCRRHTVQIKNKDVCHLCAGKTGTRVKGLVSFDSSREKNKNLWNAVKPYLNLEDRDKTKCSYIDKGKELYVYAKHNDYVRIYYFYKDDIKKHLLLKNKLISKG